MGVGLGVVIILLSERQGGHFLKQPLHGLISDGIRNGVLDGMPAGLSNEAIHMAATSWSAI